MKWINTWINLNTIKINSWVTSKKHKSLNEIIKTIHHVKIEFNEETEILTKTQAETKVVMKNSTTQSKHSRKPYQQNESHGRQNQDLKTT